MEAKYEERKQELLEGCTVTPQSFEQTRRAIPAGRTVQTDYYLSNAIANTSEAEFARVAKAEHRIEECSVRAKSEAGLHLKDNFATISDKVQLTIYPSVKKTDRSQFVELSRFAGGRQLLDRVDLDLSVFCLGSLGHVQVDHCGHQGRMTFKLTHCFEEMCGVGALI